MAFIERLGLSHSAIRLVSRMLKIISPSKNHLTTVLLSLTLSIVLVLSSGCAITGPTPPTDPFNGRVTDSKALRLLSQGKPEAAADYYSGRAERATTAESREEYQLIAAEILFDRGLLEPGLTKLADLPELMSSLELQQRRDIVFAKSLLFSDQPEAAVAALPTPAEVVSALDRARVFETRAQSFSRLDDPDNELIARIELEKELSDEGIIDKNHQQIWSMLTTQPVSRLRTLTTNVRGETYQGWLALAMANADAASNPNLRSEKLDQWRALYTLHPANDRFVPKIYVGSNYMDFSAPSDGSINSIAVLLPLSAAGLGPVAGSIRDGIIAAHQFSDQFNKPALRFYDVGENPGYVRAAYENAIADGADAVIGPLRKQAVSAIITLRDVNVPIVTLNTVDPSLTYSSGSSNVVQFGLAPEDEARAAASRAIGLSLKNAVVIQADDSRGDREARAFQDEMFSHGGDVLHVAVLPSDQYDYSKPIKDALQITQSDARFRNISRLIGSKLFFEPNIRPDVDVIFLAVSSEQARSVRPQLDFFHASNVPRFGTSRIAGPDDDIKKNRDLNSIYYPEAPWVLRESMQSDPLRTQILQSFPDADGAYAKLYALGADSYKVITNLNALSDGKRLEGYTGDLEFSGSGYIRRHLDWAQYQEGISVGVERIEADTLPTIQSGGS